MWTVVHYYCYYFEQASAVISVTLMPCVAIYTDRDNLLSYNDSRWTNVKINKTRACISKENLSVWNACGSFLLFQGYFFGLSAENLHTLLFTVGVLMADDDAWSVYTIWSSNCCL